MAWSSSGLGHRPLKAKIGGSNPLQATTVIFCEPFEAGYQLGRFVFFIATAIWTQRKTCLISGVDADSGFG